MNVYILLDRSGSMENLWDEALGSINGYVKALDGDTKVMLATFDSLGYDVVRMTRADSWKNFTRDESTPRGGTPLFDASARIMHRALDDAAERSVVVIMTDGYENGSQNFKQAQVKALATELETKKKYEVLFLGANFDKVGDVAVGQYGRGVDKFANIQKGDMMNFMATTMATSTRSYGATGQSVNLSADAPKAVKK